MKNEILVIDDNADIRFLICNILKEKEYVFNTIRNKNCSTMKLKKNYLTY